MVKLRTVFNDTRVIGNEDDVAHDVLVAHALLRVVQSLPAEQRFNIEGNAAEILRTDFGIEP
jgi:hypothetical protein